MIAHPSDAGHAYAAAAIGLGATSDGAGAWTFDSAGMHARYCRAVALSDETLFVSASRGSRGGQAAVYRRPIAGGTFTKCADGLPDWFSTNVDTGCLAASGSLVAAGDPEGSVYVSEDDGATWELAEDGLPGVTCLALA